VDVADGKTTDRSEDGILLCTRYLILDRDTKYCTFRDFVKREGIEAIRLPPRSPNLNAYAERWIRGVHDAWLSRLIPIGQGRCGARFENTAPNFIKNATTKASACADHAARLVCASRGTAGSPSSARWIAQLL
jgi:transposase InsO family protein